MSMLHQVIKDNVHTVLLLHMDMIKGQIHVEKVSHGSLSILRKADLIRIGNLLNVSFMDW
jgi:hypothetical protein